MTPLHASPHARVPLRIRMSEHVGRDHLDGGWWPQSRDFALEFSDLADHFRASYGRVLQAHCCDSDWDSMPAHVLVSGHRVEVTASPHADPHLIEVLLTSRVLLRVLVVPPELSSYHGEEALLASATLHNAETASSLLSTVTEFPGADPDDQWSDDGGSWWHPSRKAPSFRVNDD
jgi:Family of unknown function (DUF5994)